VNAVLLELQIELGVGERARAPVLLRDDLARLRRDSSRKVPAAAVSGPQLSVEDEVVAETASDTTIITTARVLVLSTGCQLPQRFERLTAVLRLDGSVITTQLGHCVNSIAPSEHSAHTVTRRSGRGVSFALE